MVNLNKCEGNKILELHINSGIVELNKKGEVKMLTVKMYYNHESIVTVLAMKDVINLGARLYMDTDNERLIIVTYGGKSYKFK